MPGQSFTAVILAAGYGTRLAKDIVADPSQSFVSLLTKPKALLPVQGVPLLDHWLQRFRAAGIRDVFIVTNGLFHLQLTEWAMTRGIPVENVVSNGIFTDEARIGACGDLELLLKTKQAVLTGRDLLVVAGDTLFYDDFDLRIFLVSLPDGTGGVVYYDLDNPEETKKRGIIEVDDRTGSVTSLLEKPDPSMTASRKACPALYAYRSPAVAEISTFLLESSHLPLSERDAPGKVLSWLLSEGKATMHAHKVRGRFDIGNLADYQSTLRHFAQTLEDKVGQLPLGVVEICPARVGLMGNPSDGFGGKTLSFLIDNFSARVTIKANEDPTDTEVTLVPHPVLDPSSYKGLDGLQLHTLCNGYYGGVRLLHATCKSFADRCSRAGQFIHLQRGFRMSYDTDIPRMVGLSGSSAIVVAAFRGLLKFFGLCLADLGITKIEFPQVILEVEKCELGIAAGLQDRVVQTYGGLVHMDFSSPIPVYTNIDPTLLPQMYLCYNTHVGGESGKVHSTVKARWEVRDPLLVQGMQYLGTLADSAVACLQSGDVAGMGKLMQQNMATRRAMYGDGAVGALNIEMVELSCALGLSAKFTGSGGALICLPKAGEGVMSSWMSGEQEEQAKAAFREHGFNFVRVKVSDLYA
jgi:glucuronokinase